MASTPTSTPTTCQQGQAIISGSVRFFVNEPIAAGATVTLTTVLSDSPGLTAGQTSRRDVTHAGGHFNNLHSDGLDRGS